MLASVVARVADLLRKLWGFGGPEDFVTVWCGRNDAEAADVRRKLADAGIQNQVASTLPGFGGISFASVDIEVEVPNRQADLARSALSDSN